MKDEKEEIKPAPLKSWKDWCREAGTECGCGDVCMYAPKPAPLGEGKKDYTDADVAFANSYQRDNKHYIKQESLGESSEEQKRDFIQDALNAYYHQAVEILSTQTLGDIERKNYEYQRDTAKLLMTTSGPPEEQEELWFEAFTESPVRIHPKTEEYLKKNFTIHRKRD